MADQPNREYGEKDLVTIIHRQESSPLDLRAALNYAHELQRLREQFPWGTVDGYACGMVRENAYDQWNREEVRKAVLRQGRNYEPLMRFLGNFYTLHPDNPAELNCRAFNYDKKVHALVLNPTASLIYAKFEPERPDFAALEAMLEAEQELGENPKVLRDISEKLNFRETYIWTFPRRYGIEVSGRKVPEQQGEQRAEPLPAPVSPQQSTVKIE